MSRDSYDFLTDATRDGLTDNVKPAASGWGKCIQYLYGILQGEKKDPFAPFRSFYEGLCKGGVSTATWDHDLAYIREKYARQKANTPNLSKAVHTKFRSGNAILDRYLAAIADGKWALSEIDELQNLLDVDDEAKNYVRRALANLRVRIEQAGN